MLLDDEYDNIIIIVKLAHDYHNVVSMSQLENLDDYYLVLITIYCQIKADMDSFSICMSIVGRIWNLVDSS